MTMPLPPANKLTPVYNSLVIGALGPLPLIAGYRTTSYCTVVLVHSPKEAYILKGFGNVA